MIYFYLLILSAILIIPPGIKWEIKRNIVFPWFIFMWLVVGSTTYLFFPDHSLFFTLLIAFFQIYTISALTLAGFFYRDPERTPNAKNRSILSPADGTVIYIKKIEKGEFPFAIKGRKKIPLKEFTQNELIPNQGLQIGIAMNFLNVHVNRNPIKGKIESITRIPGKFLSLRKLSSLLENERVLTIINGKEIRLGVVQIASRLVRRIVSYVNEGEDIEIGQRMGVIKFGSQVDVLMPEIDNLKICVELNQEIKAGMTVIAQY
jgi:phosphatidylserine decarboxylase